MPAEGRREIELRGGLAGYWRASGPENKGLLKRKALQIKLVAGTRNRLDLQLRELLQAVIHT